MLVCFAGGRGRGDGGRGGGRGGSGGHVPMYAVCGDVQCCRQGDVVWGRQGAVVWGRQGAVVWSRQAGAALRCIPALRRATVWKKEGFP